jgi:hypothetical protein
MTAPTGFPVKLSAPLGITCARQRFAPVNPHSILSFIQRIDQRSNRLTIILCHDQSTVPIRQLLSQRSQRIRRKILRRIRLRHSFSNPHGPNLQHPSNSVYNGFHERCKPSHNQDTSAHLQDTTITPPHQPFTPIFPSTAPTRVRPWNCPPPQLAYFYCPLFACLTLGTLLTIQSSVNINSAKTCKPSNPSQKQP